MAKMIKVREATELLIFNFSSTAADCGSCLRTEDRDYVLPHPQVSISEGLQL